jgi:hypothetical protein
MGGYGVTEDCPGFLGHKWMDAQLEATYEGPEAVQRRQLSITMTNELFLAQLRQWVEELRRIAATHPGSGACTLASAMKLWLWTLHHLQTATDALGGKLYHGNRQGVTFALADALCWLLAARFQIQDVLELERQGPASLNEESLRGTLSFFFDLCHVQSGRAAGEVGRICAELVFGYQAHAAWGEEAQRACFQSEELDSLEGMIPGICSAASSCSDVIEPNAGTPGKAGPCVKFPGLEEFTRLRLKLDGCLAGMRLAKDRAAEALTHVMIPEVLDYPV